MALFSDRPRPAEVVDVEPFFLRENMVRKIFGNVSRETIWKWRNAGHLEAVKYGRAVLYSMASVHALAEKLRSEGRIDRIG